MDLRDASWREALVAVAPLTVLATLVCCALPIALVTIGAGSVMASLMSAVPAIAVLSRHKEWVFAAAGAMLAVEYWILYRSTAVPCRPGGVCHVGHAFGRTMRRVFWVSIGVYGVGFVAAYLSLPVARLFGY